MCNVKPPSRRTQNATCWLLGRLQLRLRLLVVLVLLLHDGSSVARLVRVEVFVLSVAM